ncbi:MAG: rhodanese-like domain-containing protein [Bacillota bacterium]|nr:rhodanese-like domain-containing protein [Bacillota bacterium]
MKNLWKILVLGLVIMVISLGCSQTEDGSIQGLLLDDSSFLLTQASGNLNKGDLINITLTEPADLEPGHSYKIKIGDQVMESYPYQAQGQILEDLGPSKAKISLDKAQAIVDHLGQKASLIDVRTKGEYDSGHLPGAINIALDQLENQIQADKDQVLIVYCQSGRRSKSASQILADLGYKVVLDGGGISSYQGEIEK